MTAMTVRLDDELYERLRRTAFDRHESMAQCINHALDQWMRDDLAKAAYDTGYAAGYDEGYALGRE